MSCEAIWEEEGMRVVVVGDMDDGYIDLRRATGKDPRLIKMKYICIDLSAAEKFSISANTMKQLAVMDSKAYDSNPNMVVAMVTNELVMAGLMNLYRVHFELNNQDKTWETRLFDSEPEARAWIKSKTATS